MTANNLSHRYMLLALIVFCFDQQIFRRLCATKLLFGSWTERRDINWIVGKFDFKS